ncbi:MAG: N-acyl homoserine lactonase family protein [Candidatus Woesearchaeota archaeon]|jgi:glyoxylase-like metal-dependent hydrolase (beta-lactamase superfamily II)|nr:N-acyl homoserine lactonase family protein [Candidatus Woesearchaeota archaeon]|tara:strand:- start:7268 stop:7957 length:690 start_codon:yes stop_codon:yes gene_type:complete
MEFEAIRNGHLECDKGFVTLGRDMGKIIRIPVYCFLVKHPKGNVLIDTGFSVDFEKTWGKRLKFFKPILEKDVVQHLKGTKISYIINTHLHIDHSENNPYFEGAEIIVQKEELEAATHPKPYQKFAYADRIDEKLEYRIIDGNLDLFGDGCVKIMKTHGHTEGHQSVLLNLDGKKIFIAGDACYSSENLKYNCLPGILWNPDLIMENYSLIRNMKDTLIIFGHEEIESI